MVALKYYNLNEILYCKRIIYLCNIPYIYVWNILKHIWVYHILKHIGGMRWNNHVRDAQWGVGYHLPSSLTRTQVIIIQWWAAQKQLPGVRSGWLKGVSCRSHHPPARKTTSPPSPPPTPRPLPSNLRNRPFVYVFIEVICFLEQFGVIISSQNITTKKIEDVKLIYCASLSENLEK